MPFSYQKITSPVPKNFKRSDWALEVPIDVKWKKRKNKVLFVLDHVPSEDLKEKKLLTGLTGTKMVNLVKRAHEVAAEWKHPTKTKDWAYAFVNWNFFKSYDLDAQGKADADALAAQRLRKLIAKLKPTHIHFFGPQPAHSMYGFDIEKRGWVQEFDGIQVSSNISVTTQSKVDHDDEDDDDDSEDMEDKVGVAQANMLGHAAENIARLLIGKYPYSLAHIRLKTKYVDTIKKFDKFYKHLIRAQIISFDVETDNLSVHGNQWLTGQFTFESDPNLSWIVPLKHKDSPWKPDELQYIYTKLRKLFAKKYDHEDWKTPFIIGQNIGYDLRIVRHELAIPVIHYRVWDTMGAESRLDENVKGVATKTVDMGSAEKSGRSKPFALDAIFTRYENDFYYTNSFGKGDRAFIKNASLNDKGVRDYMGMDTVSTFHIHKMQLQRAKDMEHRGKSYLKPFRKLVLGVLSDTTHAMSHMQQNGIKADAKYIATQFATDTSDIEKVKVEFEKRLMALKPVKKTNQLLLAEKGITDTDKKSDSLFASTEAYKPIWEFDIHTQAHQKKLFLDVCKLQPVQWTKKGEVSLGKPFLQAYGKEFVDDDRTVENPRFNEAVHLFAGIMESKKARSTFSGYYDQLATIDGLFDQRIRAGYGFAMIVTGRSNSFNPNLQNVPQHGKYAKIIKRAFIAEQGLVNIKMDFSAHEVRMAAIMADDKALTKTFQMIWNLLLKMRKKKFLTDDDKKLIKKNDTHRINYALFNDMDVADVTDTQRQASKGITFGVLYGKSIRSLARELGIEYDEAKKIYDSFFNTFFKTREWLDWTVEQAADKLYTYNLFDLRRHLYGYLSGEQGIIAAMGRQAQNSPIQGVASQLGYMSARLSSITLDNLFEQHGLYGKPKWDKKRGIFTMERPAVNLLAMVHDSTEMETPYHLAPLVARVMEVSATTGIGDYVEKMYGIKFPVRLVVDFELGDSADKFNKWDFTPTSWKNAIIAAAKNGKARGNKIPKSELIKAIKPTKQVVAMLDQVPLNLTKYKIKD